MKKVFSTADVHPRDRFDYWLQVACEELIGHEATPKSRLKFEAALRGARLAGMDLIEFDNGPMDAAVTAKNIARAKDDCLLICRQMKGTVRLEQNSRQELMSSGQFMIIDPQRAYTAEFTQSKMLLMKVPRHMLEQRCGCVAEISGRVIGRDDPIGALASDHFASLPRHAASMDAAAAAIVSAYTFDLIALSLSRLTAKVAPCRSATRTLAVSNLRAFIELRLGDPGLVPSLAAAGAGMSLRYAQALVAEEGTSLARLIQERRLDHCEKALADPAQRHRTISEIAYAWGFADPTHFGRLFKKRLGMTPRDYRRTCLAGYADAAR